MTGETTTVATGEGTAVVHCANEGEYYAAIESAGDRLIVVNVYSER